MSNARRRSYEAIPETCPELEDLISDAENSILDKVAKIVSNEMGNLKEAISRKITEPFREALVDAYGESNDHETRADDAETELEKLKDEIRELESQVADLNREVERLEGEAQ